MTHVAYVSTYVPRRCGLATYTNHLRQAVRLATPAPSGDLVAAMVDAHEDLTVYPAGVWFIQREQRQEYVRLAQRLNESPATVVSLQHEFGIFGGEAGAFVLDLVRHLRKPLVTTFHTVFPDPPEPYRSIQAELAARSDHLIVMNRRAVDVLCRVFQLSNQKVHYIPHGTPVPAPQQREPLRTLLGWDGRRVLMTFGLINQGKGIELILRALPDVVKAVPETLYAIVGQTHPEVKRREGETYREQLRQLVRQLHLEQHVVMIDRYLSEQELVDHIQACDLYVTPYPGLQQVTSGTLAYAVGLGRPVLSTPYSYARDLLGEDSDLLIPSHDIQGWSKAIVRMLSDPERLSQVEQAMTALGRHMAWPRVGELHAQLFTSLSAIQKTWAIGGTAVASATR
ncbi:MAG: glycosyltransferase family 4 protein [Alicyclobacillus sp.]|nr:glycosyltransferase family 4 protein [Alicyclobacillus sp.]